MFPGARAMSKRARPPFLPQLLLRWFLPLRDREFILGDLDEEFSCLKLRRSGMMRAHAWYWRQSLASLFSEARYQMGDAPAGTAGEPSGGSWFDSMRQDIRYTWRSLNRRPVFTTVAVLTLALGMGANTAIFSIANWLLLRPVPGLARPEQLALIEFGPPGNTLGISWQNFEDLKKLVKSFAGVAGATPTALQVATEGAAARRIQAGAVDGNYFGVLGVEVQRGRPILPQETAPGHGVPVAVISDRLWSQLFQRDPAIIGRTLRANKVALTIVGVAERDFLGSSRFGEIDVWVPYSLYAQLRHTDEAAFYKRGTGIRFMEVVGRLKLGATTEAARADLQQAIAALTKQYPADNEIYHEYPAAVYAGVGLPVLNREWTANVVKLLLLAVAALLVISSANVANMLLVRGQQKRPETAIRRALGASTRRLARQILLEGVMLALLGGAVGLLVFGVIMRTIAGISLPRLPRLENVPLDMHVLAFVLVICLLTGLLFGLGPLAATRPAHLSAELQASTPRFASAVSLLRKSIAVLQIALSLALLVGALLIGRTLNTLLRTESGFDHERLAGISISAEPQGYKQPDMSVLGRKMLDALRADSRVEAAALSYSIPFDPVSVNWSVNDPLERSDQRMRMQVQWISDDYFRTVGIPILRGRALEARDWQAASSSAFNIVLTAALARELFGERDPLGQSLTTPGQQPLTLTVVGIARDARLTSLRGAMPQLAYWPMHSFPFPWFSVVLRARAAPAALEPVARHALTAVDPNIPLNFKVVSDNVLGQVSTERLLSTLFSLFSLIALLLAAVGLYGVLASIVGERRREFGIRMALGARARQVLGMVAQQSARLVLTGLLLGSLAAFWLSRLLRGPLSGENRLDAWICLAAVLLFSFVAALATAIPTRAATRVQPAVALRHE